MDEEKFKILIFIDFAKGRGNQIIVGSDGRKRGRGREMGREGEEEKVVGREWRREREG